MKRSKFDIRRTIEVEGLGKITASQGTLNFISIALSESSKMYKLNKCAYLEKLNYERSRQIYEILASHGFYTN